MNSFERIFWLLYFEFLEAHKDWVYRGIPIALCVPFYTFVQKRLEIDCKGNGSSYPLLEADKVQSQFEGYLPTYEPVRHQGDVVFYDKFLRIPYATFRNLVAPSHMILLISDKKNVKQTLIPGAVTEGLDQYLGIRKRKERSRGGGDQLSRSAPFTGELKKQLPAIMQYIDAFEDFFSGKNLSLAVLGETNSMDTRVMALVARQRGIPTLCLQHGSIISPFGYVPKIANYQAVYGRYEQLFYERRGVEHTAVPIIGHPRFDEWNRYKRLAHSTSSGDRRATDHRRKVMVIDHHTDKATTMKILDHLIEKAPDLDVYVRTQKGIKFFKKYEDCERIHLLRRQSLYETLSHVDAVVTYESTVVLEALLAEKKPFVWKLSQSGLTDYISKLPVDVFSTAESLVEELLRYVRGRSSVEKKSTAVRSSFYIGKEVSSTPLLKALIQSIRQQ